MRAIVTSGKCLYNGISMVCKFITSHFQIFHTVLFTNYNICTIIDCMNSKSVKIITTVILNYKKNFFFFATYDFLLLITINYTRRLY